MSELSHDEIAVCVDLGKTSCRAVATSATAVVASVTLAGISGTADGGFESAARIRESIDALPSAIVERAQTVGVGAAGTLTSPAAGRAIAAQLADGLGLSVAVTSDVITAHLGAFGGSAGAILIAGTGAVAIGIDDTGTLRRVDGWGPDIGDLGSGSWIGREGIRAVLGASSGITPGQTTLTSPLAALTEGADPVVWASASANRAGQLARFAPVVLDNAEHGDPTSIGIVDAAITHLTASTTAAAQGNLPIAILGGLTQHSWFATRLIARLRSSGLRTVTPHGSAIDGARLATIRFDLPHERHIHRA